MGRRIIPPFEFKFIREGKIIVFHFDLFPTLFSNQIVSIESSNKNSRSEKINFPLSSNSMEREKEKNCDPKLFFDSKSITIERNIHLYTFIYDYYPTTDIFLATIELSSYEEYIFLAHSTRPPPHLPRPASWQHHRDDVVTSLFYYSTRGVVDVFAVTLEHVSARLSRVERS